MQDKRQVPLGVAWLLGILTLLVALQIAASAYLYDSLLGAARAVSVLERNHKLLLENQEKLSADLAGLDSQTRENMKLLEGRLTAGTAEIDELKRKLGPVNAFVRRGDIIFPE